MKKIYSNSVDEIMDALEAEGVFDEDENTEDTTKDTSKKTEK